MKNIYLLATLLFCSFFSSQIVNIPDANFKTLLLSASATNHIAQSTANPNVWVSIDTNNDGEIQQSEAAAIDNLDLFNVYQNFPLLYSNIQSLTGIKAFSNATRIALGNMYQLTNLDVSNLTNLKSLFVYQGPNLTSVNVNGCNAITNLHVEYAKLTNLNTDSLPLLKILYCNNNLIQSLNLANNNQLQGINANSNALSSINVSNLTNLININVTSNNISSLNLSNLPKLENVTCSANILSSINLNNSPKLKSLQANINNLTSINLQNPLLNYVMIMGNQLTSIDLSNLPLLTTLNLSNNQLTSLDIRQNTLLSSFSVENNNLQSLFIKNGKTNSVLFANNPNISYICGDDSDINLVVNALNTYGYTNVTLNSYCSFTPGGNYYTLQGNTKYDGNNNGCDTNDMSKAFQKFTVTNGTVSGNIIASTSGNYSIPLLSGSHTITPVLENPLYFNISPTSFTANFPMQTSPLTQNFCLTANGAHNDLEVVIIPITTASPGFNAKYKIIYKNKGTITQSGTIVYNFNDNLMNYLNSTLAPTSQSTGVLNWNFTNLLPFESREITLTFTLNTPTQTPPLLGGNILNYNAQINGATDETPLDNAFTLNQTVINSFDPNDKTCLEGTTIATTKIGDYVHYLIRFENMGTANAQNIVVKDVIDASKFDLSSLIALNGSHSFITRITGSNIVEFIFENIQLPFDNANNDGYVSFKIKTKSTLAIGDSFNNTANIYFDYNAPIITNTYTTTVQNILGTSEVNSDKAEFSIYPNPVKDVLFIKSEEKIIKAEIYDVAGRIISSTGFNNNSIDVSQLSKGNYIIKLFIKDKTVTQKFIKN